MKKFLFFFVFINLWVWQVKADDISFKASAPQAVAMGEQFRLTYTINSEAKDLRAPDLSDFEVLMGPSSSVSYNQSMINGEFKSETTTSFTYILMPKKEGTFNLGPATIKAKKANYTSNSLVIKVLPPNQSTSSGGAAPGGGSQESGESEGSTASIASDAVFMRMIVSKTNVYEQEGFLVTFKLYSASQNIYPTAFKFPEFEGFVAEEIELPQEKSWVLEHYNGKNYNVVTLKQSILFPQRTGNITIGSGTYDVVVRVRKQRKVRSIFDDFFDDHQDIKKTITSAPATIRVKQLPSGKPADFSGVGAYKLESSINTTSLKTNEALTIKLNISGTGNIKLLKTPEVDFPNDFEVYDPKFENNYRTTASGVSGTRSIEYMAIPRYAGDFEIPAIKFSYFDIASGTYKTLSTNPYKIHVEKGEGGEGAGPVISNFGGNRESVKYLGKDIRYIKQVKEIHFTPKSSIFFGSLGFWLIYILITVAAGIFFVVYRKKVKENSDIALMRVKRANKTAVRRLKKAESLLKENKKAEFYDEVMRAVWGYLSDKLNIPTSELTKDNIEAELLHYGVDEALIKEFIEVLNTCEFARYAPSQAPDAMDSLFALTVDTIEKMENTIKRK